MNNNNEMDLFRTIIVLFTLAMAVVLFTACGEEYDLEGECDGYCEGSGELDSSEPLPDDFVPEPVPLLVDCTGQWLDRWAWTDQYWPSVNNCQPISIYREAELQFHYSELQSSCTRRVDRYFEEIVPREDLYRDCIDGDHGGTCPQLIFLYETWRDTRTICSEPGYYEHIDEPESGIRTAYEYWNGVQTRYRLEFLQ